jgi:Family of unknown function (DUF5990)
MMPARVELDSSSAHPGVAGEGGCTVFDPSIEVRQEDGAEPIFAGPLVHGPPAGRFLYLSWRNPTGEYARRIKAPLGTTAWDDVAAAASASRVTQAMLSSFGICDAMNSFRVSLDTPNPRE